VSNAFPTWLETERFFLDLEVTTHAIFYGLELTNAILYGLALTCIESKALYLMGCTAYKQTY